MWREKRLITLTAVVKLPYQMTQPVKNVFFLIKQNTRHEQQPNPQPSSKLRFFLSAVMHHTQKSNYSYGTE